MANGEQAYSYTLHPLELSEYTRILHNRSGIKACMYIDESASYERWKHPLWMIVAQGDPYYELWVAISISDDPQIIAIGNKSVNNDRMPEWIEECRDFVIKFHQLLTGIAYEKIDSSLLYDILDTKDWKELSINDIDNLVTQLSDEYSL